LIDDHILASYFDRRMDAIRAKVDAIALAMGLSNGYVPIPVAMQVPLIAFDYLLDEENNVHYLFASKILPAFPATCFGGFVIVEQNFNAFSLIDPDEYRSIDPPMRVPASHEMFVRGDIIIRDNAVALEEGERVDCHNKWKLGKPYKNQTLPVWLRPSPKDATQAAKTELESDKESAFPSVTEAIARRYYLEVNITEEAFENGVPLRDLSEFVVNNLSMLKVDEVLNGILLVNPACISKLFGPTPFDIPDDICDIKDELQETIRMLY